MNRIRTVPTNRTLSAAFALLAFSLLPTVIGIGLGPTLGITAFMVSSPWISLGVFLGITFVLLMVIAACHNELPPVAYTAATAFTFVMGLAASGLFHHVLQLPNGVNILSLAMISTIAITAGCSLYALTTRHDFSSFGGFLLALLLGVIVVSLLNAALFHLPMLSVIISAVSVVLFSAYLIYDVQSAVNGGETSPLLVAISLYLDIFNMLVNLISLLGHLSDD